MSSYEATPRTRLARKPARGHYDQQTIHAILDEGLICHVGFAVDGQPYVVPTVYARVGQQLYFHGSPASRMLSTLASGAPCCITVTLADGLVLARSAKKHSFNYRSVMILGHAREVADEGEKNAALLGIVEHTTPGRAADLDPPTAGELNGTAVLAIALAEVSAKVRSGGPNDKPGDVELPIWAGQLPLSLTPGTPVPASDLAPDLEAPPYVRDWLRGSPAP